MRLTLCAATMQSGYSADLITWHRTRKGTEGTVEDTNIWFNSAGRNLGVVGSYQKLYERANADVLVYTHDDVIMREEKWDERLLLEFSDPQVSVVGFGGAIQHGEPQLYRVPYHLQHLRRSGYLSNVDDAEVHGQRFTGARDVAVLDGYVLAVRRSFLDRIDGWQWMDGHCDFFCYDYAICAMARRMGSRVRVVGVRCHHRGGRTSVSQKDAVKGIVGQAAYDASHRWFYEEFRDVMPYEAK